MIDLMDLQEIRQSGLRLQVVGGTYAEPLAIETRYSFAVLGRADEADVPLADESVSYRHAYLQTLDGRLFCIDLGGKSGLHWNDGPRAAGWLPFGQPVRVGCFTVEAIGEARDEEVRHSDPLKPSHTVLQKMPQYELEFFDDSIEEARRPITRRITLVGRQSICPIRLNDESVSRAHCAFVLEPDGLHLIDLLGKNGTLVDGEPVRHCLLENGAEVSIGTHKLAVWKRASSTRKKTVRKPTIATPPTPPEPASTEPESLATARDDTWWGTLFEVDQQDRMLALKPHVHTSFRFGQLQTEVNALRRKLGERKIEKLLIDLSDLEYHGAELIRALVNLTRAVEERGGRVALCCPTESLRHAMTASGLTRLWRLYDTRIDAIRFLDGGS